MRVKTEAKRQAFIEAAAALFAEKGYPSVSMSDIAERAKSAKATLYNYFDSKELMFVEVVRAQAGDSFANAFVAFKEPPGECARERVAEFGRLYAEALTQPRVLEAVRLAQHEGERSGLGRLFYENGPRLCWGNVSEWLKAAMEAGALRQADPWACALHLKALLQAEWFEPCLWGVMNPSQAELAEFIERAVDAFFRAYAPNQPA